MTDIKGHLIIFLRSSKANTAVWRK